jgi:hypothetical protein
MALDLVGPIDALTNAIVEESKRQVASPYEVVIIGLTNRPFRQAIAGKLRCSQESASGGAYCVSIRLMACRRIW